MMEKRGGEPPQPTIAVSGLPLAGKTEFNEGNKLYH
jgi:hypothetical protein